MTTTQSYNPNTEKNQHDFFQLYASDILNWANISK